MPRKVIRGETGMPQAGGDTFLAVSHEMRAPLSAIRTTSDLLRVYCDILSRKRRDELFDVINSATSRLSSIVEDILLVSRLDGARVTVRLEAVDAGEAARAALSRVQSDFERSTFCAVLPAGRITVRADAARIVQVLVNLLSNAAKYSFAGSPIVLRADDHGNRVRFSIENEGPGIHPADRATIFTRFGLAERRDGSSMGVGLYISRRLVQLMEGHMGYESVCGKKTVFWFDLSRATAPRATGPS